MKAEASSPVLEGMKFTLSVSPAHVRGGLDMLATDRIRERLRAVAHRIHDINFTHHVEPFTRDAHGVHLTPQENEAHLRQVLALQEATGITVTPVFNNVHAPNTEEALAGFVEAIAPAVERGLRSLSVPHLLWMKLGHIQKRWPWVELKNTVLRRVRSAQEFWNCAEAGYHHVNLDRVLVRDRRTLREIRLAQDAFEDRFGRRVSTSLLDAEGCLGACALWEEHYQHTLCHPDADLNLNANLEVFRLPQQFSCYAVGHPLINFPMSVGLPWFREDLEEICQYFDVIKLAGRRSFLSIGDCLARVEHFAEADGPLILGAPSEMRDLVRDSRFDGEVASWRSAIRSCRFQCWNCSVCAELIACIVEQP